MGIEKVIEIRKEFADEEAARRKAAAAKKRESRRLLEPRRVMDRVRDERAVLMFYDEAGRYRINAVNMIH